MSPLSKSFLLGACLFALALATRFGGLDAHQPWTDEYGSMTMADRHSVSELFEIKRTRKQPYGHPLNDSLIRLSRGTFGRTVFASRLPSALLGSFGVLAMFVLSQVLFRNRAVSCCVGLFALSSPAFLHFCQNARGFPGAILFSAISLLGLEMFLRRKKTRYLLLALGAIGGELLFHSTATLSVAVLVAMASVRFVLGGRGRGDRGRLLLFVGILVLGAGSAILLSPEIRGQAFHGLQDMEIYGPEMNREKFLRYLSMLGPGEGDFGIPFLVYASCFGAACFRLGRRRPALCALFVVSLVLPFLLTPWGFAVGFRYYTSILPFLFLAYGYGLWALPRGLSKSRFRPIRRWAPLVAGTAAVAVIVLNGFGAIHVYHFGNNRANWVPSVEMALRESEDVDTSYFVVPDPFYSDRILIPFGIPKEKLIGLDKLTETRLAKMEERVESGERIVLFDYHATLGPLLKNIPRLSLDAQVWPAVHVMDRKYASDTLRVERALELQTDLVERYLPRNPRCLARLAELHREAGLEEEAQAYGARAKCRFDLHLRYDGDRVAAPIHAARFAEEWLDDPRLALSYLLDGTRNNPLYWPCYGKIGEVLERNTIDLSTREMVGLRRANLTSDWALRTFFRARGDTTDRSGGFERILGKAGVKL